MLRIRQRRRGLSERPGIMDQATVTEKPPKTGPFAERTQGSRPSRNRPRSRHKDEIYKFYILNNKTLSATIEHFRKAHALKAW